MGSTLWCLVQIRERRLWLGCEVDGLQNEKVVESGNLWASRSNPLWTPVHARTTFSKVFISGFESDKFLPSRFLACTISRSDKSETTAQVTTSNFAELDVHQVKVVGVVCTNRESVGQDLLSSCPRITRRPSASQEEAPQTNRPADRDVDVTKTSSVVAKLHTTSSVESRV